MDYHFSTQTVPRIMRLESIEDWDARCDNIDALELHDVMVKETYHKKTQMCARKVVARVQKKRQGSGQLTEIAPRTRTASQHKVGRHVGRHVRRQPVQAPKTTTPENGAASLQREEDAGKRHSPSPANSTSPSVAKDWADLLDSSLWQLQALYNKMATPVIPRRELRVASPYVKDVSGLDSAAMVSLAMQSAAGYYNAPAREAETEIDKESLCDSDSGKSYDSNVTDDSPPTPDSLDDGRTSDNRETMGFNQILN